MPPLDPSPAVAGLYLRVWHIHRPVTLPTAWPSPSVMTWRKASDNSILRWTRRGELQCNILRTGARGLMRLRYCYFMIALFVFETLHIGA